MDEKLTRRGFVAAAAGLAAGTLLPSGALVQGAQPSGGTLYARLGGFDAIAAVTDDFVGRLATDPQIAKFFAGHSQNSVGRIRQLLVEQICAATGGPCVYLGRDMKTAHKGLGISEADWKKGVDHLTATLNKFKVPDREQKELLAIVSGLKSDIVEKS